MSFRFLKFRAATAQPNAPTSNNAVQVHCCVNPNMQPAININALAAISSLTVVFPSIFFHPLVPWSFFAIFDYSRVLSACVMLRSISVSLERIFSDVGGSSNL